MQIAALKISNDLDVIKEFNQFCKPTINPVLSDYFINLTHITNDLIDRQGILFEDAFTKFKQFVNKDICFSHGWGADFYHRSDGAIIDENLALYNLSQKNDLTYYNIAAFLRKHIKKRILIFELKLRDKSLPY